MLTLAHAESGTGTSLLAVLSLVVWIPAFVVWWVADRRRRRGHPVSRTLLVAAWSSYVAGVIHLVVVPEHWTEAVLYGAFFLAVTIAQLGFAVLLVLTRSRAALMVAAAADAALILLWLVTRTAGIPIGPEAGSVEAVGLLDVLCIAAEAATTVACLAAVTGARRPRAVGVARS